MQEPQLGPGHGDLASLLHRDQSVGILIVGVVEQQCVVADGYRLLDEGGGAPLGGDLVGRNGVAITETALVNSCDVQMPCPSAYTSVMRYPAALAVWEECEFRRMGEDGLSDEIDAVVDGFGGDRRPPEQRRREWFSGSSGQLSAMSSALIQIKPGRSKTVFKKVVLPDPLAPANSRAAHQPAGWNRPSTKWPVRTPCSVTSSISSGSTRLAR